SSDPEWPEYHYLEQGLSPACFDHIQSINSQIMLPKLMSDKRYGWPDNTIRSAQELFNITQPILLINKHSDCSDLFLFEFKLENAYEICFNHYNIIEKFIFYFKDKAEKIINKACANPLTLVNNKVCELPQINQINNREISATINPNKYYLFYQGKSIILSQKSYKILSLIALGLNNLSIASKMQMSARTIENYINNLVCQFAVDKKADLIAAYHHCHKITQSLLLQET
ncbi:MAG: hypothetical protein HYX60_03430, partial [Legionella longbeachae]|nr:hypothetical protein [Legionella longbeachae]